MQKINIKDKAIKIAGLGAGAYASVKANKIGFIQKQKPLVRGLIKVAIGAFVPDFINKGKKAKGMEIVGNVGDGLIAGGMLDVASAIDPNMPAVSGVGELPTMGNVVFDEGYADSMNGMNVMGGTDNGEVVIED